MCVYYYIHTTYSVLTHVHTYLSILVYVFISRDLKPENLVFCNSGKEMQVELTDFGLSRTFLPGEMIEWACGSLEYSAPEVLLGDSYDPPKIG